MIQPSYFILCLAFWSIMCWVAMRWHNKLLPSALSQTFWKNALVIILSYTLLGVGKLSVIFLLKGKSKLFITL